MRRAIATMILALLLPLGAAASESFTLTIPQRLDAQQEIGEVRILLGLNAAPAGSSLVVSGTTTIPLGATQTVAGDSVAFESPGGNRVMIHYRPLSNFAGDFCNAPAAVEKTIALRFEGPQDVTFYRMASFVVAAPASECSDVSRRIADVAATIASAADGVAPALSAVDLGRLGLDVMLVLDKSGSIAGLPPDPGPSTATKEAIMKSATGAFIANWAAVDDNVDDRIGVVFFDNVAAAQTLPGADAPANFFLKRSVGWDPIITAVDGLTPGNSTSIGAGINKSMELWKADPAHDATVVVVTDGMQNTAPLVLPTATGFLGLPPVAGLPEELRKRFIPILTIGFGTPATVDEELIRNIAFESAGRSYISVNATTLFDDFANTLVAILKGNTASLATRRSATLSAAAPTATRTVVVDKSVRRVVFSLQWTPPLVDALQLEVMAPGSTTVAAPTHSRTLPQATIQTFEKPDVGTWSVRVRRNRELRENGPVPYTLNVFFNERHLDYRLSVAPEPATVGQPLHLRAEISYDGKPLVGLPADAVRVRVLRPKASLATVLRGAKGKPRRPQPGDPQTKQQTAVTALTSAELAQLRPSEAETLTLREEKRGIYSIPIAKASIAGSYAFEVVLDWTDPRTGHVHREERLEEFAGEKR